jgi:hypothetical protein
MIWVPRFVTAADVVSARSELVARKGDPSYMLVAHETLREGTCAQILHVGPYGAEGPTWKKLKALVDARRMALRGSHHEIYLSNPQRTKPSKLKTIIRHPVEPT